MRKAAQQGDVATLQRLVLNGADVNKPNKKGRTALHKAVENGRFEAVKYLLNESEADYLVRDEKGRNALLYAVYSDQPEILPLILAKPHDDKEMIATVHKALKRTVREDKPAMAKLLLQGGTGPQATKPADPNLIADEHLIVTAARRENEDVGLILLEHGADPNASGSVKAGQEDTPLHYAIRGWGCQQLMETLLAKGADVNAAGRGGRTPLTVALEFDPTIVPVLMKYKPNLDTRDDKGNTPLHEAAANHRHTEMASLLQAGAGINVTNHQGETPLLRAVQKGPQVLVDDGFTEEDSDGFIFSKFKTVKSSENLLSTVQVLLQNEADPNLYDNKGNAPLCSALAEDFTEIAMTLLEAKADPNALDACKHTSVYYATKHHQNEVVDVLLNKYQADPNVGPSNTNPQNKFVDTPLCLAIRKQYQTIAIGLLDAGAESNRCDHEGNVPLALVLTADEKKIQTDVFYKLLDNGADAKASNAKGEPVLYLATKTGQTKLVRALLKRKANPNATTKKDKDTCLGRALRKNYIEIAYELLEAGASVNTRDRDNNTPLGIVLEGDDSKLSPTDPQLLRAILNAGAKLESLDVDGWTPLCLAVEYQSLGIVNMLLEAGADVNVSAADGQSPIQKAVQRKHQAIVQRLLQIPALRKDGMHLVLDAIRTQKAGLVQILLDSGVSANESNSKDETPLGEAVIMNMQDIAEKLLGKDADANRMDARGCPLLLATKNGNVAMARLLLRNDADVNGSSRSVKGTTTPLGEAIKEKHFELARLFVDKQADVKGPCTGSGKVPLVLSVEKAAWDIVELLLERGASPDVRIGRPTSVSPTKSKRSRGGRKSKGSASVSSSEATPLIHLMVEQGREQIVKLMIDKDRRIVDILDGNRMSPLHIVIASGKSSTQMLRTILDGRPDVNRPFPDGNSPLIAAIQQGKAGAVSALLDERGIDADFQRQRDGMSALHLACSKSDASLVDALLSRRASPRVTDSRGRTPLHSAIESKNTPAARVLIQDIRDRSVFEVKSDGCTALHLAAGKYANKTICQYLVSAGANLNARTNNKYQSTPLHLACRGGHYDIVKYLVGAHADIDATNAGGRTPLDFAINNNHPKLIRFLLDCEADHTVALDESYSGRY